jgi:hypothetical protein
MAVSLGFGVMFATFITLILIPAVYLMLEDVTTLIRGKARTAAALAAHQPAPGVG